MLVSRMETHKLWDLKGIKYLKSGIKTPNVLHPAMILFLISWSCRMRIIRLSFTEKKAKCNSQLCGHFRSLSPKF